MSKFDEMREDYRLARLNNGAFRVVFLLLDVFKGLLKVAALGCFALGIWYLLYGYESRPISSLTPASQPEPATAAAEEAGELSPEQVAMLKEFAAKNRRGGTPGVTLDDSSAVTSLEASPGMVSEGALAASADVPGSVESVADNTEAAVEPSTDINTPAITSVIARLDSQGLDTSARSVFDNLQRKLEEDNLPGDELGESAVATPDLVVDSDFPLIPKPARTGSVTDNVLADSSSLAKENADNNPVVTLSTVEVAAVPDSASTDAGQVATGSGVVVQDERWMLAQSADAFLIQIGSTTNLPFLERFEKQLPDSDPAAIFEMLIGTRPEYALTYGLFESKEAATIALGRLSQVARKYGAYVRPYSAVQQQIRDLGKDLTVAQQQAAN